MWLQCQQRATIFYHDPLPDAYCAMHYRSEQRPSKQSEKGPFTHRNRLGIYRGGKMGYTANNTI
jgi:hypothetical protein